MSLVMTMIAAAAIVTRAKISIARFMFICFPQTSTA